MCLSVSELEGLKMLPEEVKVLIGNYAYRIYQICEQVEPVRSDIVQLVHRMRELAEALPNNFMPREGNQ